MSDTLEALVFEAPHPDALAPFFPGYAIDSLIACGGMGAVYHARQIALDREVAIKILPREFSSDEAFREGFAAEAKAMARLNHPNLIGVYDFGEADGMLFIIMEFVAGQSLYQASYGSAVDPKETARLMAEICAGLAHAHEHGILHRDIKPANILLDLQLRPKIGDFGLARPIGLVSAEGDPVFGTPHYTAPEVIDRPAAVDARADIFSLGVMLHQLLTGKLPAEDPRPPSLISGCNRRFDAIVQRATQPHPEHRYTDAAVMGRELAELATAPAGPKLRTGAAAQMARPVHRPKLKSSSGSGGMFLILLLAAGIGGGAYYYTRHAPETPAPAGQPAATIPEVPVTPVDATATAAPETPEAAE